MMKRGAVMIAAVLAIVSLACVWRFYPHELSFMISAEKDEIEGLACAMSAGGVESGKPYIDACGLGELSPQDDAFEEIMEILDSSGYRQDLRNLLPWSIGSIGSEGSDEIRTVGVLIVYGSGANDNCFLSMPDESKVVVSSGTGPGLKIYHPTDREMFASLSEYLQMHGIKEQEHSDQPERDSTAK